MRKIYTLLALLLASAGGFAQVLNQSANWPNAEWTITGSYATTAAAFEADPTVTANFAFDDDDAASGHEDNIAAESPTIDLTPAFNAGEYGIEVSVQYGYRYLANDKLIFQYWDADAATWVDWGTTLPNNSTTINDNFCTIPKTLFSTGALNIQQFSANQLANFKYRISYDDNPNGTDWNYGFCFDSPTIISIACFAPTEVAASNVLGQSADITWTGVGTFEYVLDQDAADPASGTTTTNTSYSASGLDFSTTYYFHIRTVCSGSNSPWVTIQFMTGVENDVCASAISLDNMTSPMSGTTVGALNDNLTTCTTANTQRDVFYSISVPSGSTLTMSQTNDYDSTVTVFYGDCDNRTQITCFDDPDEQVVTWANDTGSDQIVYWIQDGYGNGTTGAGGNFTLTWSVIACTNASATYTVVSDCDNSGGFLISVSVTDLGSASSLTASDDQNSATQAITATGDYAFGPYTNGTNVVISLTNDQDSSCAISSAALTQAACPPANDTCFTATSLDALTSPLDGTTEAAMNDNASNCGAANLQRDVYYSITVPSGSTLTIGQTVNNYDSTVTVFYGDCDNRTEISCFDDPDIQNVVWANDTGSDQVVYWIQDGYGNANQNAGGTFTLEWQVVACTNATATFTTVSDCDNSGGFLVSVDVTDLGSATSLTASDDQNSATQTVSSAGQYTFGPYANGTTVVITLTNDQDGSCFVNSAAITQTACPPANDNCENPTQLTVNEDFACGTVTAGTLSGATASQVSDNGAGNPDDDVWFSFVATNSTHTVSLLNVAGTPTDLVHEVLTGDCSSLTSLSLSDPNNSSLNGLTPGETYYVRVFSYATGGTPTTTFNVCIGTPPPPPANDECDGAIALTVNDDFNCGVVTPGTLGSATASPVSDNGVGNPDDDVWFSFVATNTTHRVSILNVTGTPTDMAHEVMSGDCSSLTSILVSDPNNSNPSGLTPGETYYVRVFSYATGGTPTTSFNVCIGTPPPPPANDDCTGAVAMTAGTDFASGSMETSTGGATSTGGVPAPGCGNFLGGDVWYTVEVPSTGNLTVETGPAQGVTTFDSAIALYSGDCGSMTLISCDDDGAATDAFSKLALTNRTPGEVIYIRVWEYGNDNVAPFSLSAYDATLSAPGFDADNFRAYPNPVTTVLNLSYTKNISDVAVFNLLGQQVMAKTVSATATQLDMTPLSAGTYLVKVTVDGAVKTIKVVKQ